MSACCHNHFLKNMNNFLRNLLGVCISVLKAWFVSKPVLFLCWTCHQYQALKCAFFLTEIIEVVETQTFALWRSRFHLLPMQFQASPCRAQRHLVFLCLSLRFCPVAFSKSQDLIYLVIYGKWLSNRMSYLGSEGVQLQKVAHSWTRYHHTKQNRSFEEREY